MRVNAEDGIGELLAPQAGEDNDAHFPRSYGKEALDDVSTGLRRLSATDGMRPSRRVLRAPTDSRLAWRLTAAAQSVEGILHLADRGHTAQETPPSHLSTTAPHPSADGIPGRAPVPRNNLGSAWSRPSIASEPTETLPKRGTAGFSTQPLGPGGLSFVHPYLMHDPRF